ncbi:MAG: hypothetical protein K1Y36_22275 [Blastocatellia bacterium]|nr:hypothetical protein [Blastocatellia bacterium]
MNLPAGLVQGAVLISVGKFTTDLLPEAVVEIRGLMTNEHKVDTIKSDSQREQPKGKNHVHT